MVLVVVPVVLVFVAPVPPTRGAALLEYIAAHKAVYLTELVCFVGLSVPALVVFGALAVALKDSNRSVAAVGGLLGIASEVIALALGSSPQSLHGGLVVLSNAYQDAGSAAERAGLVSAAEALIAATNAVSWAGILTAAAILLLSWVMLTSSFAGRAVANLGVVAGAAGIVAETLRPVIGPAYMLYGFLLPVWFALVVLPSSPAAPPARPPPLPPAPSPPPSARPPVPARPAARGAPSAALPPGLRGRCTSGSRPGDRGPAPPNLPERGPGDRARSAATGSHRWRSLSLPCTTPPASPRDPRIVVPAVGP